MLKKRLPGETLPASQARTGPGAKGASARGRSPVTAQRCPAMRKKYVVRRYAGLSAALFVMSLGIALVTNAHLGTTPISSLPYAITLISGLSLGITTFICNVVFVLLQKPILGSRFKAFTLLQIPVVFVFSLFIDINMWLTRPLICTEYIYQILLGILGNMVLGLGVSLEIASNATVLPGEGLAIAIAWRAKKNFGNIKVLFDMTLVTSAMLLTLIFLHTIAGLREGTLISALMVGSCVKLFSRWTRRLKPFFHGRKIVHPGA